MSKWDNYDDSEHDRVHDGSRSKRVWLVLAIVAILIIVGACGVVAFRSGSAPTESAGAPALSNSPAPASLDDDWIALAQSAVNGPYPDFDAAMDATKKISNTQKRDDTYELIVTTACSGQYPKFDDAMNAAKAISDIAKRDAAYDAITSTALKEQYPKFDDAMNAAKAINDTTARDSALRRIANRANETRNFDYAQEALCRVTGANC